MSQESQKRSFNFLQKAYKLGLAANKKNDCRLQISAMISFLGCMCDIDEDEKIFEQLMSMKNKLEMKSNILKDVQKELLDLKIDKLKI